MPNRNVLGVALLGLAGLLAARTAAADPAWAFAGKTGIGTAYERYDGNGGYSDAGPTGAISRVWFSIAQGILTETAYGLIHQAQIRDAELEIAGTGFDEHEKTDTVHTTEYLDRDSDGRPRSLAYRVVNEARSGKYTVEKHVFTDPDRQSLFVRVTIKAHGSGLTPTLVVRPTAQAAEGGDAIATGPDFLAAHSRVTGAYLVVRSTAPFARTATDAGAPDGSTRLKAELAPLADGETRTFDVAIGFGTSQGAARAEAEGSLAAGYQAVLDHYNGTGAAVGWEDYLDGLSGLPAMTAATGDGGKLLYASALALKAMEDKTHAGALIASFSIPWGDVVTGEGATGYRAVWPRDFYQCAMALLALGDRDTPRAAFRYLTTVQVTDGRPGNNGVPGWFLQKTHVDGTPEWYQVQMDQTAMPIMLGWKLWKAGLLPEDELRIRYGAMLKPAAQFLANGGPADFTGPGGSHHAVIVPPQTELERWEEQGGYSPSTTAAEITGLLAAADIARHVGDPGAADWYENRADLFAANVERRMVTSRGVLGTDAGFGRYYLRIAKDQDPDDRARIDAKNGESAIEEDRVLDAGFLELVRYGVRAADDPDILATLKVVDDQVLPDDLRVRYDFDCGAGKAPGYRRYGHDGYGEQTANGSAFVGDVPGQRGRVWPLLTGERGHYELARAKAQGTLAAQKDQLKATYVRAMECFANEGLMLPEQVWDGVGSDDAYHFVVGKGTDSATPLAWAHAEYVKLVRSLTDGEIWDSYEIVSKRYALSPRHLVPQVFVRGTNNGWGLTAMRLAGDDTWRVEGVRFGGGPDEGFKLDVYGDWSRDFGDDNGDGLADAQGGNIRVTGGEGAYTITFDDRTRRYTVAKQ